MDFADDAEDLARDGSDVADGGEDVPADAEDVPDEPGDVPGYAEDVPGDSGHASRYGDDFGADGAGAQARPSTGEPRVDAALARLDELDGRPVSEHREVFEDVHRRLRDVLGELDSGQQPQSREATDSAGRPGR